MTFHAHGMNCVRECQRERERAVRFFLRCWMRQRELCRWIGEWRVYKRETHITFIINTLPIQHLCLLSSRPTLSLGRATFIFWHIFTSQHQQLSEKCSLHAFTAIDAQRYGLKRAVPIPIAVNCCSAIKYSHNFTNLWIRFAFNCNKYGGSRASHRYLYVLHIFSFRLAFELPALRSTSHSFRKSARRKQENEKSMRVDGTFFIRFVRFSGFWNRE